MSYKSYRKIKAKIKEEESKENLLIAHESLAKEILDIDIRQSNLMKDIERKVQDSDNGKKQITISNEKRNIDDVIIDMKNKQYVLEQDASYDQTKEAYVLFSILVTCVGLVLSFFFETFEPIQVIYIMTIIFLIFSVVLVLDRNENLKEHNEFLETSSFYRLVIDILEKNKK